MEKLIFNILFFLFCLNATAQITSDNWVDFLDELAQETEDTEQIESLYSALSYLTEHPFDINKVSREDLQKLPFLSDKQIDGTLFYRKRYGHMVSIYELKNIPELDFKTISLLLPFVHIGIIVVDNIPLTVNNLLKYGRNELITRYDRGFQQKKGYKSLPDSILENYPNRKYVGEPFYHSIRYSYSFDNYLQFGLTAEKDAGEPFWNHHHKGYDFYSFHFFMKDRGIFKSIALGDYKMSFGQGLVISNDFTPSRSSIVAQAERRTYGLRRHYSTNEIDYFRGAATTLAFNKFELSLFYSHRKMDAKIEDKVFTTIQTSGLHRLINEREKLRTLPMNTFGGNIRFVSPDLCVGITALSYSFASYRMEPDPKPYNIYYFRGNQNMNASIDYLIKNRNIKFYGETAISKNRALATLNALQINPASYISLLILHRYYGKKYNAYYGNAFSQSSSVQNENGIYMGFQIVPFSYWKLSLYADLFRFPWLKYGIDAPSSGKEYMAQIDYTSVNKLSAYIRYRYKQKEKNHIVENDISNTIIPYDQHRLRLQMKYNISSSLFARTSLDGILYNEQESTNSGYMIAQSMAYKQLNIPFQADFYAAWFHTDNYASRISSYEKNLLYSFYMPSFYGKGFRLAFTCRLDILNNLSLSAKLGFTHYTDRDIIGTGLEEIKGANKTDLYTQIRWKF